MLFLLFASIFSAGNLLWRVSWKLDHFSAKNKILELLIDIFYMLFAIFLLLIGMFLKYTGIV